MIDRHFITFLAFLLTIVSGECFFFMKYFIFYEHLGAFRVCLGNFFGKFVKISGSREKGKKFHYCESLIRLMMHQKSDRFLNDLMTKIMGEESLMAKLCV